MAMEVYVYHEKKQIAVALVKMYEYSVDYAADYVGVDRQQVLRWLYEHVKMPSSPFFSQIRTERVSTPSIQLEDRSAYGESTGLRLL